MQLILPHLKYVCGVDGCPSGWVVAWLGPHGGAALGLVPDFGTLLEMVAGAAVVAVDIPIGLLDRPVPGGRECDRIARNILGPRGSSVFSPPAYGALACETYGEALAANRAASEHGLGISKQCFGLFPKLRDVHDHMTPDLQARIHEVHPELSFYGMNNRTPLEHPKRTREGQSQRLSLLRAAGIEYPESHLTRFTKQTVAPDDILDALAAAWTAQRIAAGEAEQIPEVPQTDARGLRLEMRW